MRTTHNCKLNIACFVPKGTSFSHTASQAWQRRPSLPLGLNFDQHKPHRPVILWRRAAMRNASWRLSSGATRPRRARESTPYVGVTLCDIIIWRHGDGEAESKATPWRCRMGLRAHFASHRSLLLAAVGQHRVVARSPDSRHSNAGDDGARIAPTTPRHWTPLSHSLRHGVLRMW